MKADVSRQSFNRDNAFSRVLMLQGRLLLDADFNEQTEILLHYLRTLVADLRGPYWGPGDKGQAGFGITVGSGTTPAKKADLVISPGHYWVDGLLCENRNKETRYKSQPCQPGEDLSLEGDGGLMVYLDVWEQAVTTADDPSIGEAALGPADTSARTKVMWQVRGIRLADPAEVFDGMDGNALLADDGLKRWTAFLDKHVQRRTAPNLPRMAIRAGGGAGGDGEGATGYTGAEHQLYRVEVYAPPAAAGGAPQFIWCRNNAAYLFAVEQVTGNRVQVAQLGVDGRTGLREGDWVELEHRCRPVTHAPGGADAQRVGLLRVSGVSGGQRSVTLDVPPGVTIEDLTDAKIVLRRWDTNAPTPDAAPAGLAAPGDSPVHEGRTSTEKEVAAGKGKWVKLEEGIEVTFDAAGVYRPGDYWLVPARAGARLGSPTDGNTFREADGVTHHYAPLAWIKGTAAPTDLRRLLAPT